MVDENTDGSLGWQQVCQLIDHTPKVMGLGFGGTEILTHRDEDFLPAAVTLQPMTAPLLSATSTCYHRNLNIPVGHLWADPLIHVKTVGFTEA